MEDFFAGIEKFNFWGESTVNLGFSRDFYLEKISAYAGGKLVKVLVGQRRVGKSYILRQMLFRVVKNGLPKENTLYINREYTEFGFIESAEDLERVFSEYKRRMSPKGKIALFIDEIQNIKGWEQFVNSHSQDFTEECDIYISGSNSKML